jgi:hypothetical protein
MKKLAHAVLTSFALLVLITAGFSESSGDVAPDVRMNDERLWAMLQGLMDDNTDETTIEHLTSHGFKVEKIQPLQEYIANGRQALYRQAKEDWKRQCSLRSALSKDELVAELDAADQRYAAVLHGLIENLPLVLSASDLKDVAGPHR